jgi:hypothetical protein
MSLSCGLIERLPGIAPNAQPPVKQCAAEEDANPRNEHKRAKGPVLLKPFHAAKLFFTAENAEITETSEVFRQNEHNFQDGFCLIL